MRNISLKPLLAAVLFGFLFCGITVGLVSVSRGIPAVFDGNETFSSILHAKNLLTFDTQTSAGLADESTSPQAQAHPVVHTHQGNFPRLYATALSALGLSQPQSQVLATALPIGFVSVLLIFAALYRYAGFSVATLSVAVLLTDYILFVQWQVVTYRIWHFAFTAALLATVVLYRSSGRAWLLAVAFIVFLFLFYYELVFATFLATSIAAFTLWLWRNKIIQGIGFVAIQFFGAVAGAAVLAAQLVLYLGRDGFLTDLRFTFTSRNIGISDPMTLAALRGFVEENNIAFFYNFADASTLTPSRLFLDAMFRWGLQVYTPPFAYCILVLAFGIIVACFARSGRVRFPNFIIAAIATMTVLGWLFGSNPAVFVIIALGSALIIFVVPDLTKAPQPVLTLDAAALIGVPALVFLLVAVSFFRFSGFERVIDPFWQYGSFALALSGLVTLLIARRTSDRRTAFPLDATVRGAGVLCAAIAFSQFHFRLYDPSLTSLWTRELPGPFVPALLQNTIMILATGCATAIAVLGPTLPDQKKLPLRETVSRVAALIVCFLLGLLVVVVAFPGYVYSGYLVRYLNVMVLPFALTIGVVFYAATKILRNVASETINVCRRPFPALMCALTIALPVFLAAWWIAIQTANVWLFPPNEFAVLSALEGLAPNRPKIVANSYPVPFSVTTGQWSYLDETFSSGRIVFSPRSGYGYVFDRKYLWFADRATNPEYNKPDVFVCFLAQSYRTAALQLTQPGRIVRCADNGIVQLAEHRHEKTWPYNTIIARDPSGRDFWAIVNLDWDYPPYLSARPQVAEASKDNPMALTVSYEYRQQDGVAENHTEIEIWSIARNGSSCFLHGAPLVSAKAVGGRTVLTLAPTGMGNTDLIVLARPQTGTRTGASFFSAPFRIEPGVTFEIAQSCGILIDSGGRHWPQIEGY